MTETKPTTLVRAASAMPESLPDTGIRLCAANRDDSTYWWIYDVKGTHRMPQDQSYTNHHDHPGIPLMWAQRQLAQLGYHVHDWKQLTNDVHAPQLTSELHQIVVFLKDEPAMLRIYTPATVATVLDQLTDPGPAPYLYLPHSRPDGQLLDPPRSHYIPVQAFTRIKHSVHHVSHLIQDDTTQERGTPTL